ncbi:zinc finger, CCHC-type containing protein [Tanacetum coccineum]
MSATIKHVTANFSKLDKFKGMYFRRRQKKMNFFLTSMLVVYDLSTPIRDDGDEPIVEETRKRGKWGNEDCDSLEAKYMTKDASSKKAQENNKLKSNNVTGSSFVNMVEHNNSTRYNDNIGKRKHQDTKDGDVAWWIDSGAACKDRCWFKIYESLNDGSILHIGNESATLVHGHGNLDEEVCINQPRGFVVQGSENKACKLVKSLYGLKQEYKFSMKDMGEADVIRRIRIKHEMSTPMDTSEKLKPNNGKVVSHLECLRVIGCLMYVMTCTMPDIAFVD